MRHYDFANPVLMHSRLKKRYERQRRAMLIMRVLSAACFLAALVFAAWMSGGPAGVRTDGMAELAVAVAIPVAVVAILAALARFSGR